MTRIMYDSITASNIPRDAEMVAGYVDGKYKWSQSDWALFPNAVHVPIAVFPWTNDGAVLDVENGDASPNQAPGWVNMRRQFGVDPSVYCSESVWDSVRAAFASAGIAQPHYWVAAHPGNGAVVPDGAVAHQWIDDGPYDRSVVVDYWPGIDAVRSDNMFLIVRVMGTNVISLVYPNGDMVGLVAPSYQQSGLPVLDVDQQTYDNMQSVGTYVPPGASHA